MLARVVLKESDDQFHELVQNEPGIKSVMEEMASGKLDYDNADIHQKPLVRMIELGWKKRLNFAIQQKRQVQVMADADEMPLFEQEEAPEKAKKELKRVIDYLYEYKGTEISNLVKIAEEEFDTGYIPMKTPFVFKVLADTDWVNQATKRLSDSEFNEELTDEEEEEE